jgi:hypothetical protein
MEGPAEKLKTLAIVFCSFLHIKKMGNTYELLYCFRVAKVKGCAAKKKAIPDSFFGQDAI